MDQILPWLLSAGGGAVAGNLVGLVGKLKSLSPVIKTILGAIGGAAAFKGVEMSNLLTNLDSVKQGGLGLAGGGLLTMLLGNLMPQKSS